MSVRDRMLLFLARESWRFARHAAFAVRLETETGPVVVPIRLGTGMDNLGDTESWFRPVFRAAFRDRRGTFLDVGANIGQTLVSLLRVSRDIPYLGLEPNPRSCAYVETLIHANRLACHRVLPVGAAAAPAVQDLMLGNDFDVSASLVAGFRPRAFFTGTTPVLLDRGDTILERAGGEPPVLIKVDVEGGELEALQGLAGTLRQARPLVVIEVLGYRHLETDPALFAEAAPGEVEAIIAFRRDRIRQLGEFVHGCSYRAALIQPNGTWRSAEDLDPPPGRVENNYLLVPAEMPLEAG